MPSAWSAGSLRALAAAAAAVAAGVAIGIQQRRLQRVGVRCGPLRYWLLRWRLRRSSDVILLVDFDRTVTTARCGVSCHGVVEGSGSLSSAYRAETAALYEHYYPIETDPEMPSASKVPLMIEWYEKAHALLSREPLTHAMLERAVDASPIALRPGFAELVRLCRERDVPLVLFSAGLGNVARLVLERKLPSGVRGEGVPIVSNWLIFDGEDGEGGRLLSGISEPLVHMYNKHGATVKAQLGEQWEEIAAGRRTVLVVGDSLGDATMADGLGEGLSVCRVGFVNTTDATKRAKLLPQYERAFDALVLDDGPWSWITHEMLRGNA